MDWNGRPSGGGLAMKEMCVGKAVRACSGMPKFFNIDILVTFGSKFLNMKNKLKISDILLLLSAFLSLIFSETLWFKGEKEAAIFIGLWVPSILGFAIYLKLIKNQKDE
ncbi:hypothetical protein BH10BAC4_BH10BAC4_07010 [soil metagenome]